MPTLGRGGAGNIVTQEDVKGANRRSNEDLEGNQKSRGTGTPMGHEEHAIAPHADEHYEQEFAHMGRGGAGNYYSPVALSSSGHFSDAHRSNIFGDGTLAPPSSHPNAPSQEHAGKTGKANETTKNEAKRTRTTEETSGTVSRGYQGRGGAGNYLVIQEENAEKERRRVVEEQERIREKAVRDVEMGLERPGAAVLRGNARV
ncbi:hypothetical protein B0A49_00889 [Cryomyces minteri]|uniref:Uncharacterized protein n=1 Tax=Cryomyces minteri TaxID=331657 RepID=A0A4U0Y0E0_9PEZI|nr:hypothetical protein B0A49_00889 [Cryomyces minteri]